MPTSTAEQNLPPIYTAFSNSAGSSRPIPPTLAHRVTSLPSYTPLQAHLTDAPPTPAQSTVEHVYHLESSKGPWATLHVSKSSASSPHQVPQFFQGDAIAGRFGLNVDGESLHAITVTLKGRILNGTRPSDAYTFVEENRTLWNKSMGDPHTPGAKFAGKFKGEYTWPYTFTLPSTVTIDLPGMELPQTYNLPQSFSERHTRAAIEYELVVRLSRGKLRVDSVLSTIFTYIPCTRPGPPSALRQLAYQENKSIPGLKADSEGWQTMPAVELRGQTADRQWAAVKVTLSLAKPLCYTRGTVIPLILNLESDNRQVLETLSAPRAIVIRLRRRVLNWADPAPTSPAAAALAAKNSLLNIETALWWPSTDPHSRNSRLLNGEIHVPKDLKPTSTIAQFSIDYAVAIAAFDTPGFVSLNPDPMLEVPVGIATMLAPGPRPRAYSPLDYSAGASSQTSRTAHVSAFR